MNSDGGPEFKLNGVNYQVSDLTSKGKEILASVVYADKKLSELNNMVAILQRAKNSYIDGLKKEALGAKSGFLFDEI